jgi:thioredoxin reductase
VFNGFLSRDGSSPAEFARISREQLGRYETVTLRSATVTRAERADRHFRVTLDTGENFSSRMLLLATGLVDQLPEIEGFSRFYGRTIHSCPLCDAWEHRGQPAAVLGGSQEAAGLAIEMLLWTKDVVLCTHGPLECDARTRRQLERAGIRIIETTVASFEGDGESLRAIRFTDSTVLPREVLYFYPGQVQKSPLAEQLGCELCPDDGCIRCDDKAATCIPGLYAAGNASRGVQLVIAAAAEGALAAVAINNALVEADVG